MENYKCIMVKEAETLKRIEKFARRLPKAPQRSATCKLIVGLLKV